VAPRAYWKGYLKLSLVSCPVALFPASSEREKISFNQINKNTGNRIRYRKVERRLETRSIQQISSRATKSVKANISRSSPRSLRRLPLRASAQSRSTSSCLRKKSTSFI
jgi:non-homologous end joining protein Ku